MATPSAIDEKTSQTTPHPSWKADLEKAFWMPIIGPAVVPAMLALGAAGASVFFVLSGELRKEVWPPASLLEVYLAVFVVPAGFYIFGQIPALLTGIILGWAMPRIGPLWQRLGMAALTGTISPLPLGLTWSPAPSAQSPTRFFMGIEAVSAVATVPILHRRKPDPAFRHWQASCEATIPDPPARAGVRRVALQHFLYHRVSN